MANEIGGVSLAMVVALATKIAKKYESVGITSVAFTAATSTLVFTLSDGTTFSVVLELTASGITYSNTTSGLLATTVQNALDEIVENFNNYTAFQIVRY